MTIFQNAHNIAKAIAGLSGNHGDLNDSTFIGGLATSECMCQILDVRLLTPFSRCGWPAIDVDGKWFGET